MPQNGCRLATALVVATCCVAPGVHAQPAPAAALPPVEIRAPHYGDTLFYLYQDQWFDGIVRAEAYESMGLLGPHAADAELLLGGMYLSFGQHARATDVFRRLLADQSTPQPVRDRAWFHLGKALHARGYYAESGDALRRPAGQLPAAMEAERRVLLAQGLMELGRYDEAVRQLENWSGPADWQAFGRYNLGVALIRAGRVDQGLALLDAVGTAGAPTEELRSLRDKANVAMGYTNLQADRPAAARVALERVRLNGPQSNKALLGAGWAAAAEERYDEALAPWIELRDRDLLDAAVQESYLAVPYAYGKLGAEGQAALSYEAAIAAFDGEQRRLRESVEAIRAGRLLKTLLEYTEDDGSGAFDDLATLPDSPETRYLYHLLAGHEFQEGLKDYRALGFLRRNLARRADDLEVFGHLAGSRQEVLEGLAATASSRLQDVDLADLERRRDALRAWLERARSTGDWSLLAEGEEQRLSALMAGVDAALAGRGQDPSLAEARDKARLERGVLQWQLEAGGKERAWQVARDLRRLDARLSESLERLRHVREAMITAPVRNAQVLRQLGELQPRVEQATQRLEAAQQRQAGYLAAVAVDALQAQQARLAEYSAQARFALAALYDRAPAARRPATGEDNP